MLRQRLVASSDTSVDRHFTGCHTSVIRPLFFSVNRYPHKPVWFSVRHFFFIREKFNSFFNGAAGMHGADVYERFFFFYINEYGRNVIKAECPYAKTAVSVCRITFDNIKPD